MMRDIELSTVPARVLGARGRRVIAAIGIDRYHHWRRLGNAVRDATGTVALFERLGFEQITAPLLHDHATGRAIQSLVTDKLKRLGPDDSLVLFSAGHGGTQRHHLGDRVVKTGYLIPVDASNSHDEVSTWIDLEGWLRAVSLLPAKHILVMLDACHSGIALDPIIKWRDSESWQGEPLATLMARRSRRIITSALDDEVALDSGPVYGHSLFTGCLIEGLTHGLGRGSRVTTGSELGQYVQRRVRTYPESRQTPDYGTFAFDDRGELVISLAIEPPEQCAAVGELLPTSQALVPPAPTRPSPPSNVPFSAPPPEPAEPASAEAALPPPQKPRLRRRKRSTPVVPPLPLPRPNVSSESGRSRGRRWIVIAAGSATLVIALVGYRIFGREPSRVDSPPAEPVSRDCPAGMVSVPGGTFRMGSPDGVGYPDEHPQHQVTLSAYCIDKTEVTVKAYAACVAAKAVPLRNSRWAGVGSLRTTWKASPGRGMRIEMSVRVSPETPFL